MMPYKGPSENVFLYITHSSYFENKHTLNPTPAFSINASRCLVKCSGQSLSTVCSVAPPGSPLVTVSSNPADSRATEAEELKMKCAST